MSLETLSELIRKLRSRAISSRELTNFYLERIQRLDPQLNAFVTTTAESALEAADAADHRLAAGDPAPLLGIPIAHKDIFCTQGVRTACGSRMLDSFISPYDATVVRNLSSAGAVLLGKTNMDEFAMGSSNETSFYGPVRNPWDSERVPGGSSGGSAAAVAARLIPGATGTDTGGSIRQPAAFCGITGLKPTYGRVSRFGMIAFASSLDQAGPMAVSAEDCAHLLQAMSGHDPRDSTSVDRPVENFAADLDSPIAGLRIGLPKEFFSERLNPDLRQTIDEALQVLVARGAELVDISLPNSSLAVPAYYVVAPAECSSNLARYDGVRFGHRCSDPEDLEDLYTRSRGEGFGTEVKRRILIGTYVLSAGYYDAYYLKAQKVRRLIADDFVKAFSRVDVIAGPTSPEVAFRLSEKSADPIQMYLSDVYTIAVNLAGLPALSMPAGCAQHLPVGLQLIGNYFDEGRLLQVAHQFQQDTDWHARMPAAFL